MSHDHWYEMAEFFALGSLQGKDLEDFRRHLSTGCSLCSNYLKDTDNALSLLPSSLQRRAPSPNVKKRVMDMTMMPSQSSPCWPVAAMLGALNIGLSLMLASTSNQLAEYRSELTQNAAVLSSIRKELDQNRIPASLLSNPSSESVRLESTNPESKASAIMVYDKESRQGILLASGLAKTGSSRVYELWGIENGKPVPAGTFKVNSKGNGSLSVPLPPNVNYDTFAVTLEPAGGTLQPTGPILLLGKVPGVL